MSWSDVLSITPYPGLSLLLAFLSLSLVVYFSRSSLRAGLLHAGNTLYRTCRMGSVALKQSEQALQARNREVLLEQGRQAAERAVEREFERIDHTVRKELGDYPALHRQVSEAITAIEEDYQRSGRCRQRPTAGPMPLPPLPRFPRRKAWWLPCWRACTSPSRTWKSAPSTNTARIRANVTAC